MSNNRTRYRRRRARSNAGGVPQGLSFLPMNIANQLTLLRVILIPLFVLFLMLPMESKAGRIIALIIFILASATDAVDGYLARKYDLVTTFGKFADPLADKLLVCSALICLTAKGEIAAWIVIIIIAREFIISGFRLVASDAGIVIAASILGKVKTVAQIVMIILLLLNLTGVMQTITKIVVYLTLVLTVVSLADYIWKNRDVLRTEEA